MKILIKHILLKSNKISDMKYLILMFVACFTLHGFSQNWSILPHASISLIMTDKVNATYKGSGSSSFVEINKSIASGGAFLANYERKSNNIAAGIGFQYIQQKFISSQKFSSYNNYGKVDFLSIDTKLFYVNVPLSYSYSFRFKNHPTIACRPKLVVDNYFMAKKLYAKNIYSSVLDFRSVDYFTYQLYASAGVEFWFKHYFFGLFYSTALTDLNRNFKGLKLAQIKLTMGYEISFKKKEKTKE